MYTIVLASLPLLAKAAYLDPSLQQHPLLDIKPIETTPNRVVPLTLDANLRYTFPSLNANHRIPLPSLQNTLLATPELQIINIPLDISLPGSITYTSSTPDPSSNVTWIPSFDSAIPILHLGVRKSGMIVLDAEAAMLDLESPYIRIPQGLWDVLVLATQPEKKGGEFFVKCGDRERFPELVFGLDAEEEEGMVEEFIVKPEQYILQTEDEGRCLLLVRAAEESCREDGIVLGWSAIRGRNFVLDLAGGRVGF